ncbi:hypothetical protein C9374_007313 [Naegleria lovaniensis]|uniref:Uncharacterized protein n=1 Tax=Naegleria lovaniensis TaxID=51637 RepID=A0AA88H7C0_NAELO|nr:uncharacterized protein C9374_007313 [Naegleria lovaniensis]KAG2393782.1 hypothetical protein C9374_007313 [Naegleria lovaniensis]
MLSQKRKHQHESTTDTPTCSSINNFPVKFWCSGKLVWGSIHSIMESVVYDDCTTNGNTKNCFLSAQQGVWIVEETISDSNTKAFIIHHSDVNGNELIESCFNHNSRQYNIAAIKRQDWDKDSKQNNNIRHVLKKKKTTNGSLDSNDLLLPNGFLLIDSEKYELFLNGIANSEIEDECLLFSDGEEEHSFGVHLTVKPNKQFFYEKKLWMITNTQNSETATQVIGFVYSISSKKIGFCDLSIITLNKGDTPTTTEDYPSPSILFPSIRGTLKVQNRIISSFNRLQQPRSITYHKDTLYISLTCWHTIFIFNLTTKSLKPFKTKYSPYEVAICDQDSTLVVASPDCVFKIILTEIPVGTIQDTSNYSSSSGSDSSDLSDASDSSDSSSSSSDSNDLDELLGCNYTLYATQVQWETKLPSSTKIGHNACMVTDNTMVFVCAQYMDSIAVFDIMNGQMLMNVITTDNFAIRFPYSMKLDNDGNIILLEYDTIMTISKQGILLSQFKVNDAGSTLAFDSSTNDIILGSLDGEIDRYKRDGTLIDSVLTQPMLQQVLSISMDSINRKMYVLDKHGVIPCSY